MSNTTITLHELEDRTGIQKFNVTNLPFSDRTACSWNFVDRLDGLYRKFNGDSLKLRIDKLTNMDVYVSIGDERPTNILKNTSSIKIGEWFEYDIRNRIYLAVVPKNGSNFMQVSYQINVWT